MSAKREWKSGDQVRVRLNDRGGGYFGKIKEVQGDTVVVITGTSVFGETLCKERIERIQDADEYKREWDAINGDPEEKG